MSRVFIFLALLLASAAAYQTEDESCNLLAKEKKCMYFQYDSKTYEANCKADTDCSYVDGKCDLNDTLNAKDKPDDQAALGIVGPLVQKCQSTHKNETSCKADTTCSWGASDEMCGSAKQCCFPHPTAVKDAFVKAKAPKALSIQKETDVEYDFGLCGFKTTKTDCNALGKCIWAETETPDCKVRDEVYLVRFKSVCPNADWETPAKNLGWTGGMAEIEAKPEYAMPTVSGAKTSFTTLFAAAVAAVALLLA